MINLEDKPNVFPPSGEYPSGDIKDNPGDNTGTPVNRLVMADYIQFFHKMVREVMINYPSFVPNGVPDTEYNGWQLFEALLKTRPYKIYTAKISQAGTAAPTVEIMPDSDTLVPGSTIVWTRTGVGVYLGTLANAFPGIRTWPIISGGIGATSAVHVHISILSDNFIQINVYDSASGLAQDGLDAVALEIRQYPA